MSEFWVYELRANALCLGERSKKGTYRASIQSCIPYSQITGALRAAYGGQGQASLLHAVGILEQFGQERIVQGRRDRMLDLATLPVEADILTGVEAKIYIVHNACTCSLGTELRLKMGALRSRGLGDCVLTRQAEARPWDGGEPQAGPLAVRIPDDPEVLQAFGITAVVPVYGYLFRPDDDHIGGQYVRALFEGSTVLGPSFLLG